MSYYFETIRDNFLRDIVLREIILVRILQSSGKCSSLQLYPERDMSYTSQFITEENIDDVEIRFAQHLNEYLTAWAMDLILIAIETLNHNSPRFKEHIKHIQEVKADV